MADRYSYLEADRRIARGDPDALESLRGDPELAAHLEAVLSPGPVPDWVTQLQPPRPARSLRWWLPAVPLLLAAAVLLWLAIPHAPYVGVKGEPSLQVHLRTASGAKRWDGREPLLASDAFRVEVRGVSQPYFAVVWHEPGEPSRVLVSGTREEVGLLPPAWELDDPAAGATLVLVGAWVDPTEISPAELLRGPPLLSLQLR